MKEKFEGLSWTTAGIFIVIMHGLAILGLPVYFYLSPPSWTLVLITVILLFFSELGVTAGYHRFYSHTSYKMAKLPEIVFLFLATLTIQGSALAWSHDHRLHHQYTDKEGDPYNINKGLLYAHVLWLFKERPMIDQTVIPDLMKNQLLVFQDRYYPVLATLCNVIVVLMTGWIVGDLLGALVMAYGVRLLFTYHITWFINSLDHYWGEQSYSKECSARNNAILAILTNGEGYHSFHHAFESDYRNGHKWYHFDPSKWAIWLMSKMGLSKGLKRTNSITISNRLISMDRRQLLDILQNLDANKVKANLQQHGLEIKHSIEHLIDSLHKSLRETGREIIKTMKKYQSINRRDKMTRQSLKAQLKELRRAYKTDWQKWSTVCSVIIT